MKLKERDKYRIIKRSYEKGTIVYMLQYNYTGFIKFFDKWKTLLTVPTLKRAQDVIDLMCAKYEHEPEKYTDERVN